MIYLHVWLTYPDGERVKAGEIIVAEPNVKRGGALEGEFRYTTEYLDSPRAFSLDPVALPLENCLFQANNPHTGIHQVFEDSLPDDWGRQLLIRRYRLSRGKQRVPHLLSCIAESALGALSYINPDSSQEEIKLAGLPDLPSLLFAAERYEQGVHVQEDELQLLLQAGSSPGGARPKALIESDGISWIAKFPSMRDRYDVVRLESASLDLARQSGLTVPEFYIVETATKAILLVRRFDINNRAGRRHLVSMKTLLQAENFYHCAYRDVADIVRCHSNHPEKDLANLYHWMVFNAATGNTDDHLKNIMMQHDDKGWQLTPFYDLVPNINQNMEHTLMFDTSYYSPGRDGLLNMASAFGLSKQKATAIVECVWNTMAGWESIFSDHGVSEQDIDNLRKDIATRLAH